MLVFHNNAFDELTVIKGKKIFNSTVDFGYKLLFDLAERDFDAGWKCFDLASDETVDFIAAAIELNGDTEMAKTLRQFKASKPTNLKHVRDYLVGNRKYLQSKIFRYTVDNIEKF